MVKNPPVSARDSGDSGLISGLKGSPGGGSGNHSSILAWKIPMDRSLVGYSPWGLKELDTTERLTTAYHSPVLKTGLEFEPRQSDGRTYILPIVLP